MSGFGIGHGVGLDPKMLAGGGAGGGGGGGTVYRGRYAVVTATYLPANAWSAVFAWDDTVNNVDPDGMLETVNYKEFTMPADGVLDISGKSQVGSRTSDVEVLIHLAKVSDSTNALAAPAMGISQLYMSTAGHSGLARITVNVSSGQTFGVRFDIAGAANANCDTDGRTWLEIVLWA